MSDKAVRRAPGTLQAVVLLLPCMMAVMGATALVPIVPKLLEQFHDMPGSDFWVPILVSVPSLCLSLFSILGGTLSDVFGRRKLLMGALALYGVFGMAPYVLNDYAWILVARILTGLMEAAILPVSTAMIGDYFQGAEREKWLAYQTGVASTTAVLIIAAAGMLAVTDWHGPFLLYGTSWLFLILVWRFTWEPDAPAETAVHVAHRASWAGFPWKTMLVICLVTLAPSNMFFIVQFDFGLLLSGLGITSPAMIGNLTSVLVAFVVIGSLLFRSFASLPIGKLLALEFVIVGVGFIGISYAPNYQALMCIAVVAMLGTGMFQPTLLTWAMRQLPFHHRGRGTGIWQSAFQLGQFTSPLVMALIATSFFEKQVMPGFQIYGVVALAGAVLSVALLRTTPAVPKEERRV